MACGLNVQDVKGNNATIQSKPIQNNAQWLWAGGWLAGCFVGRCVHFWELILCIVFDVHGNIFTFIHSLWSDGCFIPTMFYSQGTCCSDDVAILMILPYILF